MFKNHEYQQVTHISPFLASSEAVSLICFSHLRWDFVFQRPQHLLSRFSRSLPVIYWEEACEIPPADASYLQVRKGEVGNVRIVTPYLPEGLDESARNAALKILLDDFLSTVEGDLVAWYYTPMMLPFSRHINASVTVFDVMDELSKFRFAPPELLELERELLARADILFTGGSSLFDAKKLRHPNVHLFPSSVEHAHFSQARSRLAEPADQQDLPRPRLGFFGVIDERFDVDLLRHVAELRRDWTFVMVGPVVKIADDDLPRLANIHYLGGKTYAELPAYLAGWDVALMPFAINESTQFISPTKTPEYLAGGKAVVSTPVTDVVRHYGHLEGVQIAGDPETFVAGCETALRLARGPDREWLAEADLLLSGTSWDTTQARMAQLISDLLAKSASEQDVPALLVAAG